MALIRVKAKAMGYYDHKRQKEGQVFMMDEKIIKYENGSIVAPKWVELAEEGKGRKRVIKEELPKEDSEEVI